MTDLFTCHRDKASCPWIKESHLWKCSSKKLRTSTLVKNRTLRNAANFGSALTNVNNVKIHDLLAILAMLLFSSLFSHPKIICIESVHFYLEGSKIMKISMREIFFDNLKKSLKVSFHFHLRISRNIFERLSNEVTPCKKV